jgi:capsular polysaccharide biosynthesis protein
LTAGDVYRALWRHKFLLAVLTAVFVGSAWYLTSRQTRTYEAATLVRVQERGPDAGSASAALQASQTLAQTYAKIIGEGGLKDEIEKLVAECNRQSSANTQAGPTPKRSSGSAQNATAPPAGSCESLGDIGRSRILAKTISEVTLSGSPIQDLDLLSIAARSKTPTNARIAANAVPWALRAFVRNTGSNSEKIVTVKAATTPSSPVSRHLALNIALAVMIGLIFNSALVLLIELFRDRLPEPDELERDLGHPVLAAVPTLRLHSLPPVGEREESGSGFAVRQSLDGEEDSRATVQRGGPES